MHWTVFVYDRSSPNVNVLNCSVGQSSNKSSKFPFRIDDKFALTQTYSFIQEYMNANTNNLTRVLGTFSLVLHPAP
jgi:hypothetical protein